MKIRNELTNVCFFPYAGTSVRGRDLGPGAFSDALPTARMENRHLRRDWESGYISLYLNETESATYASQFKLVPVDEPAGYYMVSRPGTVKAPVLRPTVPMEHDVPSTMKLAAPVPVAPIANPDPARSKEGEVIQLKKVLEDPTLSPLGSPLERIPAVRPAKTGPTMGEVATRINAQMPATVTADPEPKAAEATPAVDPETTTETPKPTKKAQKKAKKTDAPQEG